MNIDGGDVPLQVVGTYTVTWDCSQSDNESCEVTRYNATCEVSKGSQTQTLEASGEVGCQESPHDLNAHQ